VPDVVLLLASYRVPLSSDASALKFSGCEFAPRTAGGLRVSGGWVDSILSSTVSPSLPRASISSEGIFVIVKPAVLTVFLGCNAFAKMISCTSRAMVAGGTLSSTFHLVVMLPMVTNTSLDPIPRTSGRGELASAIFAVELMLGI
jgi:hypothetical protein